MPALALRVEGRETRDRHGSGRRNGVDGILAGHAPRATLPIVGGLDGCGVLRGIPHVELAHVVALPPLSSLRGAGARNSLRAAIHLRVPLDVRPVPGAVVRSSGRPDTGAREAAR